MGQVNSTVLRIVLETDSPRWPLIEPWMKDLMGSRWMTELTEDESCFESLLGLQEHGGRLEVVGYSSSCEAWEEAEERLLPREE